MLKPIGGFIEKDTMLLGEGKNNLLSGKGSLSLLHSGRGAFYLALGLLRPDEGHQVIYLPELVCPALVDVVEKMSKMMGLSYKIVDIESHWLMPVLPKEFSSNDIFLYINYFFHNGISAQSKVLTAAEGLSEHYCTNVIIDTTQDIYDPGYGKSISFGSLRKWFGVCDGAILRSCNWQFDNKYPENDLMTTEHLTRKDPGYKQYNLFRINEQNIRANPFQMHSTTRETIEKIDANAVAERRIRNFNYLNELLGHQNRLSKYTFMNVPRVLSTDRPPFCYPFLPDKEINVAELWYKKVYAQKLWEGCPAQSELGKKLVANLLLLPVDQSLEDEDVERLARAVSDC